MVSVAQNEDSGAFAVHNRWGEKVIMFFEKEDDAERYAMQLEEDHGVEMMTVEVDEEVAIKACELYNYKYTIITPEDIVIPPSQDDNI